MDQKSKNDTDKDIRRRTHAIKKQLHVSHKKLVQAEKRVGTAPSVWVGMVAAKKGDLSILKKKAAAGCVFSQAAIDQFDKDQITK